MKLTGGTKAHKTRPVFSHCLGTSVSQSHTKDNGPASRGLVNETDTRRREHWRSRRYIVFNIQTSDAETEARRWRPEWISTRFGVVGPSA